MLNPKVKMEIMSHTRDGYPQEICGVVTQKGRVQRYHRITNAHPEPEQHFRFDENEYAQILDEEECEGRKIIAIVHSHPGDGATTLPSADDEARCNESLLPWVITSWPEGDMRIIEPVESPLIGRPWALGSYDCFGLVMDYHKRHGVILKDRRLDFEWWKPEHGIKLYQDYYAEDGFVPIADQKNPSEGDMVIMQIGQGISVWNHAGIYMGDNKILHHLFGKLSAVDLYGGWYQDHTKLIVRHKELVL